MRRGRIVRCVAVAAAVLALASACATAPGARRDASTEGSLACVPDSATVEASATAAAERAAAEAATASAAEAAKAEARKAAQGRALVVMDMQKGYMPIWRSDEVFANIGRLVSAARSAGTMVVWVYTQEGQSAEEFAVAAPLAPLETEPRVVKVNESAFAGTELEAMLDARGAGSLVVCGIASNQCVSTTVWVALDKGYRVTVARDAHSSPQFFSREKVIDVQNGAWTNGARVTLLPAAEITFGP